MEAERALDIHRNTKNGLFELWMDGKFQGNFDSVDEALREYLDILKTEDHKEVVA